MLERDLNRPLTSIAHLSAMNFVDRQNDVTRALKVLGLNGPADAVALKRAFHVAVKASHPDRPGGDAEQLRVVIDAYHQLRGGADAPSPAPHGFAPSPPREAKLEISPVQAMRGGVHHHDGLSLDLPAGLRAGDRFQVGETDLPVMVTGDGETSVIGDHLCLTVRVEGGLLRAGGRLRVATALGPVDLWISGQDAARGLVRLAGQGLPARGARPAGDMFVRLSPFADAFESPARAKRRRFIADWAA